MDTNVFTPEVLSHFCSRCESGGDPDVKDCRWAKDALEKGDWCCEIEMALLLCPLLLEGDYEIPSDCAAHDGNGEAVDGFDPP